MTLFRIVSLPRPPPSCLWKARASVRRTERPASRASKSHFRAAAMCHIGGDDDNELLWQKGARCRFLHVVYVSRAAAANAAAAAAISTAEGAAAVALRALLPMPPAARCNRPKKTGKKFRKTKTAATTSTTKNRVSGEAAAALLSSRAPSSGRRRRRRSRRNRARPRRPLQGTRCTKTQAACLHFRLQRRGRFRGAVSSSRNREGQTAPSFRLKKRLKN